MGWGLWDGVCGMEENKKSGGGDVRAKALSWDIAARKKSRFAEKKSASPKKNCACGGGVGVGIEGRAIVAIVAIVAIEAIEIVGVDLGVGDGFA